MVVCSCNLRAGVGDRDRTAGCVVSQMVPGSVRGCSGDTAASDRGRPYPTHVYMYLASPPHKDKERNTLLENLNVKTKKPWAGGMAQGLDAAEPRPKCDSGTHRVEEENRLPQAVLCPLPMRCGIYPYQIHR